MKPLERDLAKLVCNRLTSLGDPELTEQQKRVVAAEYIAVLDKHSVIYHFDEDPTDICWDDYFPNEAEMEHMRVLTNYLYSEYLFDLAWMLSNKEK